jgi:phosphohistidine phosphatase
MKSLLLLRHAKSSHDQPGGDDHDRPLNPRGERDAPRIGELLVEEGLVPDLIVSSTARRARDTADLVAASCGYAGDMILTRRIYEAPRLAYVQVIREIAEDRQRPLVVGHNPTLGELVYTLTGSSEHFPTGALAHIALDIERWHDLQLGRCGELAGIWRPKEID